MRSLNIDSLNISKHLCNLESDEILRKNIEVLERIAKELLKYETIDSDDLKLILSGQKLTRPLNGARKQKRSSSNRKFNSNKSRIIYIRVYTIRFKTKSFNFSVPC